MSGLTLSCGMAGSAWTGRNRAVAALRHPPGACATADGPMALYAFAAGARTPCPATCRIGATASPCPEDTTGTAEGSDGGTTSDGGTSSGGAQDEGSGTDTSYQPQPSYPTATPQPTSPTYATSESGGVDPTILVLAGVGAIVGAAVGTVIWLLCRCRRRRRMHAALNNASKLGPIHGDPLAAAEAGASEATPFEPAPQVEAVTPSPSASIEAPAPSTPLPPAPTSEAAAPQAAAALKPGFWSFAYKLPDGKQARAFDSAGGTDWTTTIDIDGWVASAVGSGWDGCIMYNDHPPGAHAWCPQGGGDCGGCGASAGNCKHSRSPTDASMHATPAGSSGNKSSGHTKGVVLWSNKGSDSGLVGWLVHSCPQWPNKLEEGAPKKLSEVKWEPSTREGQGGQAQSFLFVVLPSSKLQTVLGQVKHMKVRAPAAEGGSSCKAAWAGAPAHTGCCRALPAAASHFGSPPLLRPTCTTPATGHSSPRTTWTPTRIARARRQTLQAAQALTTSRASRCSGERLLPLCATVGHRGCCRDRAQDERGCPLHAGTTWSTWPSTARKTSPLSFMASWHTNGARAKCPGGCAATRTWKW